MPAPKKKTEEELRKEIEEELKKDLKLQEVSEKEKKRKEFWRKVGNTLEDIWMYFITIAGVLLSNYIPQLKEAGDIILQTPNIGRIVVAAAVALMVSAGAEVKGDKKGKRKNWLRRMAFHLANGVMWYTFIG